LERLTKGKVLNSRDVDRVLRNVAGCRRLPGDKGTGCVYQHANLLCECINEVL